jgi:hypothetical protein
MKKDNQREDGRGENIKEKEEEHCDLRWSYRSMECQQCDAGESQGL